MVAAVVALWLVVRMFSLPTHSLAHLEDEEDPDPHLRATTKVIAPYDSHALEEMRSRKLRERKRYVANQMLAPSHVYAVWS